MASDMANEPPVHLILGAWVTGQVIGVDGGLGSICSR